MGIDVSLDEGKLSVGLTGWHRFFAMRSSVEVALADVESVSLQSKRPLIDQVAVRMRGSSIPGRVLAGTYSVWPHARVEKGDRQFWMTYGAPEVLVIETSVSRPRRIVLELDDRHAVMLRIQEAVGV